MFCTADKPEGYWQGFFDALDVNRDGKLSRREFWNWVQMGSSDELIDALRKFNVSFKLLGLFSKNIFYETIGLRKSIITTITKSAVMNSLST